MTYDPGENPGRVPVFLVGSAYGASLTLTRTADTNAYTAGDVIGPATGSTAAQVFPNMGPAAGGEILLTSVSLQVDISAVISGMTSFRLHLYSATPPSALGDNAAWDLPSGDRDSYLGYVDLGVPVDLGSTLYVEVNSVNKVITLASGTLYGYLQTIGGYTPGSADVFRIKLHAALV